MKEYKGFNVFSARDYSAMLKATIHRTGRLGFSAQASESMNLSTESGIIFVANEEADDITHMICVPGDNPNAFNVMKAGNYYSVNAKPLFDSLGFDYKNNTIIFDLIRDREYDGEIYKLTKRERSRNRQK